MSIEFTGYIGDKPIAVRLTRPFPTVFSEWHILIDNYYSGNLAYYDDGWRYSGPRKNWLQSHDINILIDIIEEWCLDNGKDFKQGVGMAG